MKFSPKIIFLDAGNVLIYKRTTEDENIARRLGFQTEEYPEVIKRVVEYQGKKKSDKFWNIRSLDDEIAVLDEFHRDMLKVLGIPESQKLVRELTEYRTQGDFAVKPGVNVILDKLAENSRLGIISNALPSRRHHELKIDNLISYFDPIIISFEVGYHKPDPRIFEIALEKAKLHGEDVLFIDDKSKYIDGARKSGIENNILLSDHEVNGYITINKLSQLLDLIE